MFTLKIAKRSRRYSSFNFDYDNLCIICEEEAGNAFVQHKNKKGKKKRTVQKICSNDTGNKILTLAISRGKGGNLGRGVNLGHSRIWAVILFILSNLAK